MKILHTSDWHLGHTLYNYDRTEEQMAMLRLSGKILGRFFSFIVFCIFAL